MLPRVTEILKAAGMIDASHFTDFARERGTAVHMATAYNDLFTLDETTVDPIILPYLEEWRHWKIQHQVHVLKVEQEIVDETLGYVGHYDRIVMLNGDEWLIDIKCGAAAPWHAIQLAAYDNGQGRKRGCVYINPPSLKLTPYTDRADWSVFRAALSLYHWRRQCNLL